MTQEIMNAIDGIEKGLADYQNKIDEQLKLNNEVTQDNKTAVENLGTQQRELADRLLAVEQSGVNNGGGSDIVTMGKQFVDSDIFKGFQNGAASKAMLEVTNAALVGSDATVAPDRKEGVVGGAFQPLALEAFLNSMPTTSNAIEYTRETAFTNNAAEVAEGSASTESNPTFALATMPVSNVTHHTPITKQLADDSPALAAYINTRMAYGVNLRVEQQLAAGNGTAPNISGLLDAGNFTAHGYADAALGSTLKKFVLIRKMIADAWANGYPADAIVMNPADVAQLDIDALTSTSNAVRISVNEAGQMSVFGVPIIQSIGITADNILVGAFGQSATVHNRQGVVIEMTDSHASEFTSDILTIKATRRLALTVERPAGILGGDLTPV